MTKEQEVIKYIETRIKICNENADICDDNDFDEEATYLREESYMLETVLSMLKEKDKEIEKLRKNNKDLLRKLRNRVKEVKKLQRKDYKSIVTKQGKTLEDRAEQLQKKDKQIDLMAEEIEKRDIEFKEYCNFKIVCDRNCKGCIKQYFERKATNNG